MRKLDGRLLLWWPDNQLRCRDPLQWSSRSRLRLELRLGLGLWLKLGLCLWCGLMLQLGWRLKLRRRLGLRLGYCLGLGLRLGFWFGYGLRLGLRLRLGMGLGLRIGLRLTLRLGLRLGLSHRDTHSTRYRVHTPQLNLLHICFGLVLAALRALSILAVVHAPLLDERRHTRAVPALSDAGHDVTRESVQRDRGCPFIQRDGPARAGHRVRGGVGARHRHGNRDPGAGLRAAAADGRGLGAVHSARSSAAPRDAASLPRTVMPRRLHGARGRCCSAAGGANASRGRSCSILRGHAANLSRR